MGILGTIGTILPTAGNILGQIFSAFKSSNNSVSSGSVPYNFSNGITCGFKNDSEEGIILVNSSFDDDKFITLSVPAIGDMEPETVTVPASKYAPVSELFARCAAADSTKLMLSGSSASGLTVSASAAANAADCFHFAAGGRNIPVDGVTEKRIGSFLTVVCHKNKAVFKSKRMMKEITSADFFGFNDSSVTMSGIVAMPDGTGSKAEVLFPTPFPDGTVLEVDVEVDMGEATKIVAEQRIKAVRAKDADLQLMRSTALKLGN